MGRCITFCKVVDEGVAASFYISQHQCFWIMFRQQAGNFDRVFVNANLKSCFEEMVTVFKEWYPHLVEMAPDDEQKNCTSCVVS